MLKLTYWFLLERYQLNQFPSGPCSIVLMALNKSRKMEFGNVPQSKSFTNSSITSSAECPLQNPFWWAYSSLSMNIHMLHVFPKFKILSEAMILMCNYQKHVCHFQYVWEDSLTLHSFYAFMLSRDNQWNVDETSSKNVNFISIWCLCHIITTWLRPGTTLNF